MATSKIAVTIAKKTLFHLDLLVKARVFPSRNRAIFKRQFQKNLPMLQKIDLLENVPS